MDKLPEPELFSSYKYLPRVGFELTAYYIKANSKIWDGTIALPVILLISS